MSQPENPNPNQILLVDGNAILHRSYHAFPKTLTFDGQVVNAVYGFLKTLLGVMIKFQPQKIAIAFDVKGKTFRHDLLEGYKVSRKPMEDDLVSQLHLLRKEILPRTGILQYGLEGYEADDILGTLSHHLTSSQYHVTIVSGDKDILQLIQPNISVFFPPRGKTFPEKLYDETVFVTDFGFQPIQLIDYKSLAGDASDEIPGVKGIGKKMATQLIQKYESLENLYANLDKIPKRTAEMLIRDKEIAFLSKKLATINLTIPLQFDLVDYHLVDWADSMKDVFADYGFKSLVAEVNKVLSKDSVVKTVKKEVVVDQLSLF